MRAKCNGQRVSGPVRRSPGYLVPFIFSLFLSACGFHLRGAAVLPPAMSETLLEGTDRHGPLGDEIANALSVAGGQLVSGRESATAVLRILGERSDRRVLSVGADRKVDEYELHYQITYQLLSPKGEVLVPQQTVNAVRDYQFSSAEVLGKEREEETLRSEMRGYAVRQMLQRLRAVMLHTQETTGEQPAAPAQTRPGTSSP